MTKYFANKTYISNTCFENSKVVVNVDCSNTHWENNSMRAAFWNCTNLKTCKSIPDSITTMRECFYACSNLSSAPDIPASTTDINLCFGNCYSLQVAPDMSKANNMVNMRSAFCYCNNLTTVPSFPPNAVNTEYCFTNCTNLTTVANVLPNGVTNAEYMFGNCTYLNGVNLFFPSSVVNMSGTFMRCNSMGGNIYIYSTEAGSPSFPTSSTPRRNVYIPFKYDNGVNTKIYNAYDSYYGISTAGQYYNLYISDLKSLRYWNTNLNPWYNGPLETTTMYCWDIGTRLRIAAEVQSPTTTDAVYIVTDYDDGTFATQTWYTQATPYGNMAQIQVANVSSVTISGTAMQLKIKTGTSSTSTFSLSRNTSGDFQHLF